VRNEITALAKTVEGVEDVRVNVRPGIIT
jgi:hypothetical protein